MPQGLKIFTFKKMAFLEVRRVVVDKTENFPFCHEWKTWLSAHFKDVPYESLWKLQTALVESRKEGLLSNNVMLFVGHQLVFTVGRHGGTANLKVDLGFIETMGVSFFHVERGGEITYHGLGHLLIYPVVNLSRAHLKVIRFMGRLEEIMIRTAADLGVHAERSPRNHSAWVGAIKLGSIRIAVRRGVSFHELALNINTDLIHSSWIHRCGLQGVHMTSLALERAKEADLHAAAYSAKNHLEKIFGVDLKNVEQGSLTKLLVDEKHRVHLES